MTKPNAFTLIELLVVIAIIALLMSILMPVLSKAKDQARAVVGRSNLRQIGYAAVCYASDNENYVPRNGGYWIRVFMPYLGGEHQMTTDYRKVKVYNCPSYPVKEQTVDYVINSWKDDFNEVNGPSKITEFRRPSQTIYLADNAAGSWRPIITNEQELNNHSAIFDVWELEHLPSVTDVENYGERRVARDRHLRGCNGAYFDGHSAYIPRVTMNNLMWRPK
jgi:prepilin-type N-terminal cleavage/methylation domain-containing protein/prepilin-type processing-associated H-X9-DG protein